MVAGWKASLYLPQEPQTGERKPRGLSKRPLVPLKSEQRQNGVSVLGAFDVGPVLGHDHDAGSSLDVRRHHHTETIR